MKETLKSITYKKIRTMEKKDKDFAALLRNPVMANLLEDMEKQRTIAMGRAMTRKEQTSSMKDLFERFTVLQLVHSVNRVLHTDPGAYIEMSIPRGSYTISLWVEETEHNLQSYHMSITRNDEPWRVFVFWKKTDWTGHLMDTFKEKMPRNVSVYRSPQFNCHNVPTYHFIRNVHDELGIHMPPKTMRQLYNRRTLQMPEYGITTRPVFKK